MKWLECGQPTFGRMEFSAFSSRRLDRLLLWLGWIEVREGKLQ